MTNTLVGDGSDVMTVYVAAHPTARRRWKVWGVTADNRKVEWKECRTKLQAMRLAKNLVTLTNVGRPRLRDQVELVVE